jgi:CheY-like chemotaxis protein
LSSRTRIGNDRCKRVEPAAVGGAKGILFMSTIRSVSGTRRIPTVLLVDDRHLMLVTLRMMLEADPYRLLTASNGAKALDLCRADCVDLVVLDVVMPGMDGVQVADRLRANALTCTIPIVFSTATPEALPTRFLSSRPADVKLVPKPVDEIVLRQTIARMLSVAYAERGRLAVRGSRREE